MDYTIIFCIFEDYIYSIFIMRFPCLKQLILRFTAVVPTVHTCSLYTLHPWSVQTTRVEP